jgi:hypothetical protein
VPGLTIRGYARHRGVSHTAVCKALTAGRIVADADGKIDPTVADRQWAASTDLAKPRNSVTGSPKRRRLPGAPPAPLGATTTPQGSNGHVNGDEARLVWSYAGSRAAREGYMARLAKLEYEKRSGKLVDADQVRAQLFALSRRTRDRLLGIADRLAPVIAGETDAAVIHRLLTEEIALGLSELAKPQPLEPQARKH